MAPADILAYVGAASWLPQIVQWVYSAIKKPTLLLVSGETVGVTYTGFGPMVLMTTAISTEKKDALIKTIRLKVTHEKGDHHRLRWTWLNESGIQMNVPTGEKVEIGKNQPALALKVSTVSLVEKKITFVDHEVQGLIESGVDKIGRHYDYLKRNSEPNPEDTLLKSKEFVDAYELFKRNLYWKAGTYELEVQMTVVGMSKAYKQKFSMSLTPADIDLLESNVAMFDGHVRANLVARAGQPAKWPQQKWVSPRISQTW